MTTKGDLYTIGYQKLKPVKLKHIAEKLDAIVVDCRAKPRSRHPGFNQSQLVELLGERYVWKGDVLGGFNKTSKEGIAWVKEQLDQEETLLLLCMEDAPERCHRHFSICGPHFPDAMHIYEKMVILASEVNRAQLENDDRYEVFSTLFQEMYPN